MTNNRPPFFGIQQSLPQGYLKDGYFDISGNIFPALIIDWANEIARALHSSDPQLKTAQLRRFFQEVRHQEGRLTSGIDFAIIRTEILKLDSYAENAAKKHNAPLLFRNFIGQNVKIASKDANAFKAFVTHFECIVGYYPDTK
jgi:CRISPR/Cas system CSM-associated protein Csm2 small subunit